MLEALLAVLAALSAPVPSPADDAEPNRPAHREIRVPAAELENWLGRGEWRAMKREQFEKLVAEAATREPPPPGAWIARAVYAATFDGDALEGHFTWEVRRSPESSRVLLPLEPMQLPVSGLHWSGGVFFGDWLRTPAAWGAANDGTVRLLVDRPSGVVEGLWNLRGRRIGRSLEFFVEAAPAAVSELHLQLPAGLAVRAVPGEVMGPEHGEAGTWRVLLGSEPATRLTIGPVEEPTAVRPLLLAEADTICVARREGLHVQAGVRLDVLRGSVRTISVSLPADVQVYSVRYGGEFPLPWKTSPSGRSQRLTIDLPDPLSGSSRSILIEGIGPPLLDEPAALPRPVVENAVFQSGRVRLSIERPLELRDYRLDGWRERVPLSVNSEGESIAFEQIHSEGRVLVTIGEAPADVAVRALHLVEFDSETWRLRTELEWQARAGHAFTVRVRVPPGWLVTHVRPLDDSSGLSHQETVVNPDGSRVVVLEFHQAAAAGDPRRVQIYAERPPAIADLTELPIIRPLDVNELDTFVAVTRGGAARPLEIRSTALEPLDPAALPEFVSASQLWAAATTRRESESEAEDPQWLLFASHALTPAGTVAWAGSEAAVEAPRPADAARAVSSSDGAPSAVGAAPAVPGGTIAVPSGETGDVSGPIAAVRLRSLLAGEGGFDTHHATFRFEPHPQSDRFSFRLPDGCDLLGVEIAGTAVAVRGDRREYVLPRLPVDRANEVVIRYRAPAVLNLLRRAHAVPLPATAARVLRFDWTFAVPPQWELLRAPGGMVLAGNPPAQPWTKRLFGPLGRMPDAPVFNPLEPEAWRRVAVGEPATAGGVRQLGRDDEFAPPGWTVWRSSSLDLPPSLNVVLWSPAEAQALGWVGLLGCLLAGLLARVIVLRGRQRIGTLAAATWLLGALLLPPDLALIAGGALLGTLFASLLPRPWIGREGVRPVPPASSLIASNQSGSRVVAGTAGALALATAIALSWQALAAQSESIPPGTQPASAGGLLDSAVLVPIGADRQPLAGLSVVYVARPLVEQLEQLASQRPRAPEYLLESAEYLGRVGEQGAVAIGADYRLALLTEHRPLRIELPIGGAFPAGRPACRVNGEPHALTTADDGRTLLVAWDSPPGVDAVEFLTVSLQLQAVRVEPPSRGDLALSVPAAGSTHVTLQFAEPQTAVEFPGAAGHVELSSDGRTARAALGRPDRLAAAWSRGSAAATAPAVELQSRIYSLVNIRPTRLETQCRIVYTLERGAVDRVEWKIPADAIVRQVAADALAAYDVTPLSPAESRLTVEFSTPQTREFHVDVSMMLPVSAAQDAITVPPLLSQDGAGAGNVSVAAYEVGLTASSEFRMQRTGSAASQAAQVPTAAFLQAFARTGEPPASLREPLEAWRLPEPLPLTVGLQLRAPRRLVRLRQTGVVGRGELEWTLRAEVDIREASAWRHTLSIDPRMIVAAVSVRQNEAERLVRWSRSGGGGSGEGGSGEWLELFLRDESSGVQDVVVSGRMPIGPAGETPLPLMRFEGADVVESRLQVYAHESLVAELGPIDGLTPEGSAAADAGTTGNGLRVVGGYSVSHPLPVVPRLRWGPRPAAATPGPDHAADTSPARTAGDGSEASSGSRPEVSGHERHGAAPEAALLDTWIQLASGGRRSGRTMLVVRSPGADRVVFTWPASLRLRAVIADGSAVPARIESSDEAGQRLVVASVSGAPVQIVTLFWEGTRADSPPAFGPFTQQVPVAQSPPAATSLVTMAGPEPLNVFQSGPLQERPAADLALDRLAGLIAARAGTRPAAATPLLDLLIDRTRAELRSGLLSTDKRSGARERRLEALERDLGRMRSRASSVEGTPSDPETSTLDMAAAELHGPNPPLVGDALLAAGRLPAEAAVGWRLWGIDLRLLAALLMAAVAGAAVWLSAQAARLEPGEVAARHPLAAVVLVGVVWWLCLVPGVLGFLLALSAVLFGARRLFRREPEPARSPTHP